MLEALAAALCFQLATDLPDPGCLLRRQDDADTLGRPALRVYQPQTTLPGTELVHYLEDQDVPALPQR